MSTEPRLATLLNGLLGNLADRPGIGTMLDVADFLRADETVEAMAYGASWAQHDDWPNANEAMRVESYLLAPVVLRARIDLDRRLPALDGPERDEVLDSIHDADERLAQHAMALALVPEETWLEINAEGEKIDDAHDGASWWADVRTMLLRARAEAHAAMN